MGLFDKFKHNNSETSTPTAAPAAPVTPVTTSAPAGNEVLLDLNKGGLLNLQKNDFLNLSKAGVNLKDIKVAAGWDVQHKGQDYDLDLCAFVRDVNGKLVKSSKGIVFYGDKKSKGLQLDKDNLTGEGDGDDENIFVNFDAIDPNATSVIFAVVIYCGQSKGQDFKHVKNAYVRLVDQSVKPEKELCRYNLSEDGGNNTAIEFAEIQRTSDGWTFKAIGEFAKVRDIASLAAKYK